MRYQDDLTMVINAAADHGLVALITIGTGIEDGRAASAINGSLPIHWTVGMDPSSCLESGSVALSQLETLAASPSCSGIGEIGLELHHDIAPLTVQRDWLEPQLDLAARLNRAVVIHARSGKHGNAHAEILPILASHPSVGGVIHSFDGNCQQAKAYLDLGWSLAVNGMVTFKGNDALRAAVAVVPADRLLLETDAPYLAPVPHRGKRNGPAYLKIIAEAVAAARGEPFAQVWERAGVNAVRVFSLPESLLG